MEDDEDNKARETLQRQIEGYQKTQETERKLRALLLQVLEPAAYERMMNVRIANPDLFANTANAIVYYYQKIKRKLTEKEIITLLTAQTTRKESSIQIHRK